MKNLIDAGELEKFLQTEIDAYASNPIPNEESYGRCDLATILMDQLKTGAFSPLLAPNAGASHSGWLPIETAPKDGSEIWLYSKFDGQFRGRYNVTFSGEEKWHNRSANRWANPTHWQPLPQSPRVMNE